MIGLEDPRAQRAQLVLDVSKAANAHLELGSVLDALAVSLAPILHFDAIAVEVLEEDTLRLLALTLKDFPRLPGECLDAFTARFTGVPADKKTSGADKQFPLRDTRLSLLTESTEPFVCPDLAAEAMFPEERMLLSYNILSYICLPLRKHGKLLGGIYFNLYKRHRFSGFEVQLIADVGEIVAIAVANAMAYAEIRSLKERLQDENLILQDEIVQRSMYEEIVGSSGPLRQALHGIDRVAPTDSTVLITGETGTGKELFARAIHRRSPRAGRALVKVNCASLPSELIASELFGHEKGAFTGALTQRIGRFETADGGTIFLDEIGELAPDVQVALLRVLQEREFERVGSNVTRQTDTRVIAATNLDLAAEVAAGRFRSDLFYRLNVFPVQVPPLRARREDIPILVDYFVTRFARRMGKRVDRIPKPAMDALQRYDWPGNIRELQNVIERAVILSDGGVLQIDPGSLPAAPQRARSDQQLGELETILRETRGKISGPNGAAARLGIPASTLESRLRAMGINKHAFRTSS